MRLEKHPLIQKIPNGDGFALDVGGGRGLLRDEVSRRGWKYVNLDISRSDTHEPSLIADALHLPLRSNSFDLVISKDTLEHFTEPPIVVSEIKRVLKVGGVLIIWVPFMHPFHGDDLYRFSPLGLQYLLKDFDIISIESPQSVFSILGLMIVGMFKRLGMGFLGQYIKSVCYRLDRILEKRRERPRSFANAYLAVAVKPNLYD